ncbi:MAG: hypothetical protein Q7L55_09175 [Actinomycetota bacterium]|nr:hypothetical protein [Actinomycetota bacterium]
MKSPSEQLAEAVLPLLVKEGLFLPEDSKRYKDQLVSGRMKSEDWFIAAQKSLDKSEMAK